MLISYSNLPCSLGKVYPTRFMPSDTIEEMVVEKVDYSFLYVQDGLAYVMHPDTFDQLEFNASIIGDKAHYIAPNSKVVLSLYQGQVIAVRGPEEVVVTVADTDEVCTKYVQCIHMRRSMTTSFQFTLIYYHLLIRCTLTSLFISTCFNIIIISLL